MNENVKNDGLIPADTIRSTRDRIYFIAIKTFEIDIFTILKCLIFMIQKVDVITPTSGAP